MSKPSHKTEATLEGFLRGLAAAQISELKKQFPEIEHPVSFTRVVRIARGEVDATWDEQQHLEGCAECRSIARQAKARMPEAAGATSRLTPSFRGIPILVEAFALRAGANEPLLGELKPGVHKLAISDQVTGTRHARIELRPAGNVVRLRQVEGEPLLIRTTGELLGEEFRELETRREQTINEFLEQVLAMSERSGEGD